MARKHAYLELSPYYTSVLATLVAPDGRSYHLGELPKFLERTLGYSWRDYAAEVNAIVKRSKVKGFGWAGADVLLRIMREYAGFERNRQVFATLDKAEAWELWA